MIELLTIIAGTFASEDLTCITVGLLIARGDLGPAIGLTGCFLGILLGDLGLWVLGRCVGAPVLRWRPLQRRIPQRTIAALSGMLERHPFRTVLVARFVPGMRLPIYLGAGTLVSPPWRFAAAAALAGVLWTPLLVGLVALIGEPIVAPLTAVLHSAWVAVVVAAIAVFAVIRLARALATRKGRAGIVARIARLWRWEFWPAWLFYLPILPWILWLSIRHRGFTTITAANPGIPHSGIVGESKSDILRQLPSAWVAPFHAIRAAEPDQRVAQLQRLTETGWTFPLILKPDAGERGAGVRLVKSLEEAALHLRRTSYAILVQAYHPGPFEAGIFYYRLPGQPRGRILSVTDKQFPVAVGDGISTVEELILRHPRYRMQACVFLSRLNGMASTVLRAGEPFRLAMAGNHCQGTLFRDGRHLLTPELESRIDEIAREFAGFFFGRFDLRYTSPDEFRAGRGFSVIELNGATSESTNLYDPSWSLWRAYRQLMRQWNVLFEIGAKNRKSGHPTTPLRKLWSEIRGYYRSREVSLLAD